MMTCPDGKCSIQAILLDLLRGALSPVVRDAVMDNLRSLTPPGRAPADGEVLTVSEAAEHLHVSRSTIYRMIKSGRIPALRMQRGVRIPRSGFANLLEPPGQALSAPPTTRDFGAGTRRRHRSSDPQPGLRRARSRTG